MSLISYLHISSCSFADKAFEISNHSSGNVTLSVKNFNSDLRLTKSLQSRKLLVAAESFYRFSKLQEKKSKLFQELLDKYWRQTIFLSNTNPIAKKYSALLAKQEGMLLKNNKKKFMASLSKALQNGQINVGIDIDSGYLVDDTQAPNRSIRYIWNKNLNIRCPEYLNGLWTNRRAPDFPNPLQKKLLANLEHNKCPIFVLVNGLNQIVVSEPSSQIIHQNNVFHKVYMWYYDRFLWKEDGDSVYQGWFFVNAKDAEEYASFIKSRYPRSSHHNRLSVIPISLHSYYRLNRMAPPRTQFRLFPDLEEVGKLVTSSAYRKGLHFDEKQTYGRNYFQGQPIYLIESVNGINRQTRVKNNIDYFYKIPGDPFNKKYTGIFFNKAVALNAWSNFRHINPGLKLPAKPNLSVYNLEDFFKDNEYSQDLNDKNVLFIPSQEGYEYIKSININQVKNFNIVNKQLKLYKFTLSLWFQRLVCSLTSSQPPNW